MLASLPRISVPRVRLRQAPAESLALRLFRSFSGRQGRAQFLGVVHRASFPRLGRPADQCGGLNRNEETKMVIVGGDVRACGRAVSFVVPPYVDEISECG